MSILVKVKYFLRLMSHYLILTQTNSQQPGINIRVIILEQLYSVFFPQVISSNCVKTELPLR